MNGTVTPAELGQPAKAVPVRKRIFLYICGIMNLPGASRNWTGRAVTWTHLHSEARAEKCEYFTGPIGRAFGQRERETKLFRTLEYYQDWDVHLVGHSNGCAVILQGMQRHPYFTPILSLHLVCGACEADFDKNGLNSFLADNRVGHVTVYCAGEDRALRFARFKIAQMIGYGGLGFSGPLNVRADVASKVKVVDRSPWDWYGHSTCFQDDRFDGTMQGFLED